MTPQFRPGDFEKRDLYPAHIVWLVGVCCLFLGFTLCAFLLGL